MSRRLGEVGMLDHLVMAGLVLDDADMLGIGASLPHNFQEDRQTWYVTQSDVGRTLYTADGRPRAGRCARSDG